MVHVYVELFELVKQRQYFAQIIEASIANQDVKVDFRLRMPEVVQLSAWILQHDVIIVRVDDVGSYAKGLAVVGRQAAQVKLVIVHEDARAAGINESTEICLEEELLISTKMW